MRIVLATGIYPPAIGGTATYSDALAKELSGRGHEVRVVTYGVESAEWKVDNYSVRSVAKKGNMFVRWIRYAKALKNIASDADAVLALSSVSVGIPLMFAGLKKPKKILRLGGDFFWERATDGGCMQSLREWYASRFGFWRIINTALMEGILSSFDTLVYSTEFQRKIHERAFTNLPKSVVIGNASPISLTSPIPRPLPSKGEGELRQSYVSLRLLFLGRFVGFKNLFTLLDAVADMPDVTLTLVGSGPLGEKLRAHAKRLDLGNRVRFLPPVTGIEKQKIWIEHDLLVIPSVTEISPNVALEAVSSGLPVLLTEETGYSSQMSPLLAIRPLRTAQQIVHAVRDTMQHPLPVSDVSIQRTWKNVTDEWLQFLLSSPR